MRRIRAHLSYANVMATIAVFVALGGGAYAAITLPKNSVGTKQLKKKAVTRPKIKANAVVGSRVAADSLTGADIRESSLAKVPFAANADTAGHATNADTATSAGDAASVGHMTLRKVAVSVPIPSSGTTTSPLFTFDGLTLSHDCVSGTAEQKLRASTSEVGLLKVITTNDDGMNPVDFEDFDFGPSDGTVNTFAGITPANTANLVGRLIWQTESGNVLTFEFQSEVNAFATPPNDCTFGGTVVAG